MNDKLKKLIESAKSTVVENEIITSHIEIISNNHILIQGATGVLEYDSNLIRIRLNTNSNSKSKEVQILGEDFLIEYLTSNCVEIRGEIFKLEFVI